MPELELNVWNELAPPPLPRAGCAVGVIGGELLVAGGTYWRDGRKFWSERVDAFDLALNLWMPRAALPRPHGDAAALTHDGALYVFGGGAEGGAGVMTWVLRNNHWSRLDNLTLPAPRRSSSVAVVDGNFYLLGGLSGTGADFASATSTVWAAAPDGRWEPRSPMPGPPRFNLSVGVVGGRVLVAGGCTPENDVVRNLDEILAYDPAADAWTQLGSLPRALRAAGGLADAGGLLIFGGYTDRFETEIFRYDATNHSVEIIGRLPEGLAGGHFLRLGRYIIGLTGENGIKQRFPRLIHAT
ncbi:MAG TPA: kelch repeat-containing protein [Opitutaceae bacterium]|nr:kelch repeat-containing protein [Opitutaceae bacterium]HRJ47047.1 kelch repeat-containing protein [Opitutaceae bacterium]